MVLGAPLFPDPDTQVYTNMVTWTYLNELSCSNFSRFGPKEPTSQQFIGYNLYCQYIKIKEQIISLLNL